MTEKLKLNRIKAVLAEKDIQQKQLAQMVGLTVNAITKICNNDSQPTLKHLYDIAQALDVDIRELLVKTK